MRALSSILYIVYGLLKKEYIMFASAIMPLILEVFVLVLYFLYKSHEESNDN